MPSVQYPLDRVYRGTVEHGVIRLGDQELLYNKTTTVVLRSTANYKLPAWANYVFVLAVGGGKGGQAGSGANNSAGRGAEGGLIAYGGSWIGQNQEVVGAARSLDISYGAGGQGGQNSDNLGANGGTTVVTPRWTSGASVVEALGGTGGVSTQDGGARILPPPVQVPAMYPVFTRANMALTGTDGWRPQTAGTGSGGSGSDGGGGAGGNGGFFGSFTRGGKGGDGLVRLTMWGYDPTL